ncbi:MAG: thioredoxin domain-containing protein [Patescibacteria group bacterium]|nr:thioredoxin domain-containing protein [Patescibacteria group bacterium]
MAKKIKSQKKDDVVVFNNNPEDFSLNIKFLYFVLGALLLFNIFLAFKIFNLERKVSSGITTADSQKESLLSVNNLKKYAKELKLNTNKFNKCLDSGEKAKKVDEELKYGASLGVQGTPGFFINGKFLAGAFPIEFFKEIIDKELSGQATNNCFDYSENLRKYCEDKNNQAFNPESKNIDLSKGQMKGNKNALVSIVEFSDFECPYCARAYGTVKEILKTYKDKVKFYYFQYPLNFHPNAQKAAEASLCAADQGKFWEFHDKLFEIQNQQAQ